MNFHNDTGVSERTVEASQALYVCANVAHTPLFMATFV